MRLLKCLVVPVPLDVSSCRSSCIFLVQKYTSTTEPVPFTTSRVRERNQLSVTSYWNWTFVSGQSMPDMRSRMGCWTECANRAPSVINDFPTGVGIKANMAIADHRAFVLLCINNSESYRQLWRNVHFFVPFSLFVLFVLHSLSEHCRRFFSVAIHGSNYLWLMDSSSSAINSKMK